MEWIPIPSFAGNLKELGLEPVKAVAPKVVLHLKEMAVVAPVEDTRVFEPANLSYSRSKPRVGKFPPGALVQPTS
jgi:hypothetical protein